MIMWSLVFCVLSTVSLTQAATFINTRDNPTYQLWPRTPSPTDPTLVQYNISLRYDPASWGPDEFAMMQDAAEQLSQDLGHCINFKFITTTPTPAQPHLWLMTQFTGGQATYTCYAYPGRYTQALNNGQIMVMFGSRTGVGGNTVGGCLDSKRDTMRYFANAIGLMNEWQRNDRATYITFQGTDTVNHNTNVHPSVVGANLFAESRMYTAQTAVQFPGTFDLNGITMITGDRYAKSATTPVFTVVGSQAVSQATRLSENDCRIIKQNYGCPTTGTGPTPSCNMLANTAAGVTLNPNPSILSRTIQCATGTTVENLPGNGRTLGYFWMSNPTPVAGNANRPTVTITPKPAGVEVEVVILSGIDPNGPAVSAVAATLGQLTEAPNCVVGTPAGTTCYFAIKLRQTQKPLRGMVNQQITANLQFPATGGTAASTVSTSITLNLNCGPIFQSITANEGTAAALTTQRTFSIANNGIRPTQPQFFSQGDALNAVPAASLQAPADPATLNLVNFDQVTPFGQTGAVPAAAGTPPPTKVYVNCAQAAAPAANLVGPTVLGQVAAIDPEGGEIDYYAISGQPPGATTAGGGWDVHVSKSGVITISHMTSSAAVTPALNNNIVTGGTVAVTAAAGSPSTTVPLEVFITAIDSNGGKSVLRSTFFLACGPLLPTT